MKHDAILVKEFAKIQDLDAKINAIINQASDKDTLNNYSNVLLSLSKLQIVDMEFFKEQC